MNYTVIGHFCFDMVFKSGEEQPVEYIGGIAHSLAALAALAASTDVIFPVFGVGTADYDRTTEWLKRFPNVNADGVYKFKGMTNRVHYYPSPEGNGFTQCPKQFADPIPSSRVRQFLDVNGVLINMQSGFDLTLETLDFIRTELRERKVPIHFDFHTLTLGIDGDSKRFRRPMTDWRRWCFMINSVQMNQEEAAGLTAERFDEATLINHMMPLMVDALLITRHQAGTTLIRQDQKKLTRYEIPGVPIEHALESKGAGDVFGAAFLYQYLKTRNVPLSAAYANLAGGVKTMLQGVDEYSRLPELMKEYKEDALLKPSGVQI